MAFQFSFSSLNGENTRAATCIAPNQNLAFTLFTLLLWKVHLWHAVELDM